MDNIVQYQTIYNIIQYTMTTIWYNTQYNTIYNDYNMIQYTMITIDNAIQ